MNASRNLLFALECLLWLCPAWLPADPLDQWTWRNPAPTGSVTTSFLSGVTYGRKQFVAVGSYRYGGPGTIVSSPDGANWTVRSASTTNLLNGIAYGACQFVAVGSAPLAYGGPDVIVTSPDGITWSSRNPGSTNGLSAVAFGNSQFVAVGGHGTILTSPDGAAWTGRSSGLTNGDLTGIAYGNNQFVAVGQGYDWAVILTSTDGINWTSRDLGTTDVVLSAVAYGHNQFVATGSANVDVSFTGTSAVFTSSDGLNWTDRSAGLCACYDFLLPGIAYGNNAFVVVASDGPDENFAILTSPDGISWTNRLSGYGHGLDGVACGNDTFVVVGGGGFIMQSGLLPPAQPVLGPVTMLAGSVAQLTLSGDAGQTYAIQASSDLSRWLSITNLTLDSETGQFLDPSAPNFPQRFYRAVRP